jgi:hypothetical protein
MPQHYYYDDTVLSEREIRGLDPLTSWRRSPLQDDYFMTDEEVRALDPTTSGFQSAGTGYSPPAGTGFPPAGTGFSPPESVDDTIMTDQEVWALDPTTGYQPYQRPTWLEPVEQYMSPAALWQRQVATQAPYWQARVPMGQLGQRLQARYSLGAPQFYQQTTADAPTFMDYSRGYMGGDMGGWEANTYDELLRRARLAAEATRTPTGEYLAPFTVGTPEWEQAAWYAGEFGPGEEGYVGAEQQARQLAAATLLARQRRGPEQVGAYGGQMGTAIANALARQQQYRENLGQPAGTFLDWYVSQIPRGIGGGAV